MRMFSRAHEKAVSSSDFGTFETGIVLEYIQNPIDEGYSKEKIVELAQSEIVNSKPFEKAPNGSIICKLTNREGIYVAYPFFSGHLSMPAKPGEHVWIYRESSSMVYWICRKQFDRRVTDLNYTHAPRRLKPPYVKQKETPETAAALIGSIAASEALAGLVAAGVPIESLPPLSSEQAAASPYSFPSGPSFQGYEDIIENSESIQEFSFEAVPRHRKKCGDTLIQGSNNNLILMTDNGFPGSGNIQIIAGIESNPVLNEIKKEEQNKFDETPEEGDLSLAKAAQMIISAEGYIQAIANNVTISASQTTMTGDVSMAGASEPYMRFSDFQAYMDETLDAIDKKIEGLASDIFDFANACISPTPLIPTAIGPQLNPTLVQASTGLLNLTSFTAQQNEVLSRKGGAMNPIKSSRIFGE